MMSLAVKAARLARPIGRVAAVSWWTGAVVTVIYGVTAAPGLFWGDSAEFLAVAHTGGVAHPPGYPLYTLLAGLVVRAGGAGSDSLLNLLSALAAGAAAGLLAQGLVNRGANWPVAALTAAGWALGQTAWRQAVVAEVYALHALLVAALVALALARPGHRVGLAAAAVVGLGLAHHPLILGFLPLALVAMLGGRPAERGAWRRYCLALFAAVVLPLTLYLYLPVASLAQPAFDWGDPESLGRLIHHLTARQYAQLTGPRPPAFVCAVLLRGLATAPRELPWPWLLLAPWGGLVLHRRQKALAWGLATSLLLTLLLAAATAATFNPPYLIGAWLLLAVLGGLGAADLAASWVRARVLLLAVLLASLLLAAGPGREVSQRGNTVPTRYAQALLETLPRDAVVLVASDSLANLLLYRRLVKGQRPDIDVISLGDLPAVGSDEVLRRNFPRLVLPPRGYRYASWPDADPAAPVVKDTAPFVASLIRHNQGTADRPRPLLVEYAPGLEWAAGNLVPDGHLWRWIPSGASAGARDLSPRVTTRLNRLLASRDDPETAKVRALVHNALGWYWLDRGDLPRAEAALRQAPRDAATLGNLAVLYLRQNRLDDARAAFAAAHQAAPWDAALAANRARFLSTLGDPAADAAWRWARRLQGE